MKITLLLLVNLPTKFKTYLIWNNFAWYKAGGTCINLFSWQQSGCWAPPMDYFDYLQASVNQMHTQKTQRIFTRPFHIKCRQREKTPNSLLLSLSLSFSCLSLAPLSFSRLHFWFAAVSRIRRARHSVLESTFPAVRITIGPQRVHTSVRRFLFRTRTSNTVKFCRSEAFTVCILFLSRCSSVSVPPTAGPRAGNGLKENTALFTYTGIWKKDIAFS